VKEITVRLTLRTLLAYLDDTLEPLEIKTIGQKVAESETAQELIARIKQTTRRRRITTPPATGPNSFDPNMVADYLDNELSAEQVAELEKICLDSDVHLAEVASCHQILTLVLGEPATVSAPAYQRMYALVQGREAIPFRKAAAASGNAAAPTGADADADEMFLLGLPFYRRGSWLRWALPLAAVVLFTIVGVALWQTVHSLPQPTTKPQPVAQTNTPNSEQNNQSGKESSKAQPQDPTKINNAPVEPPKTLNNPNVKPPDTPHQEPKPSGASTNLNQPENSPPREPETRSAERHAPSPASRDEPPLTTRVAVGQYHTDTVGAPSLLVLRRSDAKDEMWNRVKPGDPVYSSDSLMSLPGYASEVRLSNGLHLLLRGHVREFTPPEAGLMDHLQESVVVLHQPKDKDVDADLTLRRGRLFLSNHSVNEVRGLLVRLRFDNKAWDLMLHPDSEVVVDLFKLRRSNEPLAMLKLFLLKGTAGLALEHDNFPTLAVPGWAQFHWVSSNPAAYDRSQINKKDLDYATRTLFPKRPILDSKEAQDMERALKAVMARMTVDKPPLVALLEVLKMPGLEFPFEHRLAVYCLGAMDEVKELMNILGQADALDSPDRLFAIVALRRWLDRGANQSNLLFDAKAEKGALIQMSYTKDEASRIMALLADPTSEQIFLSRKYYEEAARDLGGDKVAIAELARWRLVTLVGMFNREKNRPKLDMPKLSTFNAAKPSSDRRPAMQEVLEKVNEGLLPPSENGKPSSPSGTRPPPKGGNGTNPRPKP
jgi:hypothetical protein